MAATPAPDDRVVYKEPARSYVSAALLFVLLVAGWIVDTTMGAGTGHAIGWILAVVVVVGIDVVTTRAARASRSVLVTRSRLHVGDTTVDRSTILGVERDIDGALPVLGRPQGSGLPRGTPGLAVHLVDGGTIVVPTRHPAELTRALALTPNTPEIRRAVPEEQGDLVEIETRADTLFRVGGWGEGPAVSFGERFATPVVVLAAGRPAVGFARLEEVAGCAHLAQLSVVPSAMRRGVGGALLEAACSWAAAHGFATVTLTCYLDVPWNAPFFGRHGFVVDEHPSPDLRELRDWERSRGLDDVGQRIVMRRELPPVE